MQVWPSNHPPGGVCLITGELTRYALAQQSIMSLKLPPGSINAWFTGMLVAKSLNSALQSVIDNPTLQWAWIMGDDHTFEPETVFKLLDRDKDVIAPLCLNRLPPMDPTIIEHDKKRMKYLEDLPKGGGLYRLKASETCGDAGLLIRRHVLEKIGAPWYDHRISGSINAEDQAFIQRIKDAGFDVFVDLDVRLGHIGNVVYAPVLKAGGWEVRIIGGGARHVCDLGPSPRADDAFQIAGEVPIPISTAAAA